MRIKILKLGILETNCYILESNGYSIVIDPADDYEKIKEAIGDNKLIAVLVTHYHFDHIGALEYFSKELIYDNDNLEEKEYELGPFKFNVIKTYGHTFDNLTFYFKEDNVMFVGDFIFKDSIGRWDLGGDYNTLMNSINKIKKYPNNTIIYPGHGDKTMLGEEKKNNYYFKL